MSSAGDNDGTKEKTPPLTLLSETSSLGTKINTTRVCTDCPVDRKKRKEKKINK